MDKNSSNSDKQAEDLSGSGANTSGSKVRKSFFRDLITRRVPQILGGYLAGSWIVLEFIDWLIKRYPISPHLDEFCLITLAAMVPTVVLLSYFHGKPGRDHWTRVEKIGIPVNVIGTVILLVFLFNGRELGAITTTVNLTDEYGQEFERSVPKSEFRKKLAIFSLENETGDPASDWMIHAIPDMIRMDLMQDMYLDIKSVYELYKDIRDEGFPDATGIPLILKKKISENQYMDYFVAGTMHQLDDLLSVQLTLYETRTVKSLEEKSFAINDLPETIDEISVWLKESLSLPEWHIENTIDLPVSEIVTKSALALKTIYSGMNECYIREHWDKGVSLLEQSVHHDSTFAYAYKQVSDIHYMNARSEESMRAFQYLMKYLYKLPERLQFEIEWYHYLNIKKEPELAMKVVENWVELYPEDVNARILLAHNYMLLDQRDNLVAAYRKILSLDPGQYDYLLRLGEIYKYEGKFEEALEYYRQYADALPNDSKSFIELGNLYKTYGKHEQAYSDYQNALLIKPDDISLQLLLADMKTEMGDFNSALMDYEEILGRCNTPREKMEVYTCLENYYFLRGQVQKAIHNIESRLVEQEKFDTRMEILFTRFFSLERYILAGKIDTAFQIVREMEETLGPPQDFFIPWAYLKIYLELEQAGEIEKYLKEFEAYFEEREIEALRPYINWAQAKLNEIRGDYLTAIRLYSKIIEANTINPGMDFHIGRCYRMNKDFRKAEEHFKKIIDFHPYWPEELYEFGLLYAEWGKQDKAIEYLKRAQDIWADADPNYKPALMLREKMAELEILIQ